MTPRWPSTACASTGMLKQSARRRNICRRNHFPAKDSSSSFRRPPVTSSQWPKHSTRRPRSVFVDAIRHVSAAGCRRTSSAATSRSSRLDWPNDFPDAYANQRPRHKLVDSTYEGWRVQAEPYPAAVQAPVPRFESQESSAVGSGYSRQRRGAVACRSMHLSSSAPSPLSLSWQSDRTVDGGPGDYFVADAIVRVPATIASAFGRERSQRLVGSACV